MFRVSVKCAPPVSRLGCREIGSMRNYGPKFSREIMTETTVSSITVTGIRDGDLFNPLLYFTEWPSGTWLVRDQVIGDGNLYNPAENVEPERDSNGSLIGQSKEVAESL